MDQVGRAVRRAAPVGWAFFNHAHIAALRAHPSCMPLILLRSRHSRPSWPAPGAAACRNLYVSAQQDASWRDSICISVDCEDEPVAAINVEDQLFDMFKDDTDQKVHMGRFLAALTDTGLRKTDPRLLELRNNLMEVHTSLEYPEDSSINALQLEKGTFKRVIQDNIVLISRALRHQFVIPEWLDFISHIEEFYWSVKGLTGGKVASYIPQLTRFSPDHWGVSVCTIDGQRYSIGDTDIHFTMQSCSKPVTYAIALNELGNETVHKYVGTEPSGRMFNAIVLDYNDKPHNPLVNAGSILVNGLLQSLVKSDMSSSEKFDYLQQYFKRMAGGEYVGFSNGTFLSERENADRNFSLGYYMRENKCFPEKCDLMASLDLYFQVAAVPAYGLAFSVSIISSYYCNYFYYYC
ncbi:glutaminase kidney isoform, mitochondrial-like isoform X2 [Penaeus chinensis]|uniref:glutaminase kidney isoform, mitochondrial-like isoform X2 n=1 Tax=Penaeus chinensis TaxID=139456 RepID=UPI001FB77AA4|nr:glutaminase kidney isoform, mitochondrial-like isoform X2 [Penaeus chinensis]